MALEYVASFVFDLTVTICEVILELTGVPETISLLELSSANPLVTAPVSLERVTVWIPDLAEPVSSVVLEGPLKVLAVLKQDLNPLVAQCHLSLLKPAFNDLSFA